MDDFFLSIFLLKLEQFVGGDCMEQKDIIKLSQVDFTYPEAEQPAVKALNLTLQAGTWTALIGHNGSGKSTVSKLLDGLLFPTNPDSQIMIAGLPLTPETVWEVRKHVGIVFQNPDHQFVGATVADDVAFGLENRGISRAEMQRRIPAVLAQVGMADYADAEPSHLSGGQKQRVAIAGVLAVKPQIMILDEATAMLDPEGRKMVIDIVRKMMVQDHLTIISITHDLDEANLADQVLVLDDGQLIATGTPAEVFQKAALLERSGLALPFFYQLKYELMAQGINIPTTITTETELVAYLCQLNLNM